MSDANRARPTVTAYLVREFCWRYNGQFCQRPSRVAGEPSPDRTVEAYVDPARARARRRILERARRAVEVCPFRFGDEFEPSTFTTRPFAAFAGRLRRAGLEPPRPTESGYYPYGLGDWWALQKRITPAQVRAVWKACDRVRFYTVAAAEVPLGDAGPAGYLVFERTYRAERFGLRWCYAGELGRPVRAFGSYERAEAFRLQRELRARAGANPFRHVCRDSEPDLLPQEEMLGLQTSFEAGPFCDWLLDAGLTPPALVESQDYHGRLANSAAWVKWWERESPGMSESQRAKVWEALDKVRFYEVAEA